MGCEGCPFPRGGTGARALRPKLCCPCQVSAEARAPGGSPWLGHRLQLWRRLQHRRAAHHGEAAPGPVHRAQGEGRPGGGVRPAARAAGSCLACHPVLSGQTFWLSQDFVGPVKLDYPNPETPCRFLSLFFGPVFIQNTASSAPSPLVMVVQTWTKRGGRKPSCSFASPSPLFCS